VRSERNFVVDLDLGRFFASARGAHADAVLSNDRGGDHRALLVLD
jgi:hypothetical protein